eukprot:TRINITY_DN96704_c0_g1_i1.p2 TRINITY_DN96704_c0_g1~~TRINITY_DN96704_c0_g1_i1.p2  ORF type:complete len:104 (-),score=15.64 TRINITY_DN96704_c0_g1_i1:124-396(-)
MRALQSLNPTAENQKVFKTTDLIHVLHPRHHTAKLKGALPHHTTIRHQQPHTLLLFTGGFVVAAVLFRWKEIANALPFGGKALAEGVQLV